MSALEKCISMRKNKHKLLWLFALASSLFSCKSQYLEVKGVAYQSIKSATPVSTVPDDAVIVIYCNVGIDGAFDVTIKNNTDKVMTVDRSKSFFRDGTNNSIPYYDPTIVVNTQSTTVGGATGASVNLGSLASAAGIGGVVGTALNGVSVGGSNGSATTNTSATYVMDQERIMVAPHSSASMGRSFTITGIGQPLLSQAVMSINQDVNNMFTPQKTYASCNLCITYSVDDGQTFETIVTDIYADRLMVNKVWNKGKVNEALRNLYSQYPNAILEPWFLLHFESNSSKHNAYFNNSAIINYK